MTVSEQALTTFFSTSVDLANLDVPQGKSYFVWCKRLLKNHPDFDSELTVTPRKFIGFDDVILCDAFTLSEIVKLTNDTIMCSADRFRIEAHASLLIKKIKADLINPKDLKL